jgi:hypothetical protein
MGACDLQGQKGKKMKMEKQKQRSCVFPNKKSWDRWKFKVASPAFFARHIQGPTILVCNEPMKYVLFPRLRDSIWYSETRAPELISLSLGNTKKF